MLYSKIEVIGFMKKNSKGFIATTLIYSFLILFATLVVVIIGNYSYYRTTLIRYNQGINDILNDKIDSKYITLYNEINNSNLEVENDQNSWNLGVGVSYSKEASIRTDGEFSLKFTYTKNYVNNTDLISSTTSNKFQCKAGSYYYVSYNIFTTGNIDGTIYQKNNWGLEYSTERTATLGLFSANGVSIASMPVMFAFQNWERQGILGQALSTEQCQFMVNYVNQNNTLMYIDNVIVTDVTNIVSKSGLLDSDGNLSDTNREILINNFTNSNNSSDSTASSEIKYFSNYSVYNMDNLHSNLN